MLRKSKIDIEDREMLASDSVEWEEDGAWRRDSVMLAAGEVDGGYEGADEEETTVMMVLAQLICARGEASWRGQLILSSLTEQTVAGKRKPPRGPPAPNGTTGRSMSKGIHLCGAGGHRDEERCGSTMAPSGGREVTELASDAGSGLAPQKRPTSVFSGSQAKSLWVAWLGELFSQPNQKYEAAPSRLPRNVSTYPLFS